MILALVLFVTVSRLTFFLLLYSARRIENKYHLDYLIAHLGCLAISSLWYLLFTGLNLNPKLGVLNSLFQIAALTFLYLHVDSVIMGSRSKFKIIYFLPPTIFIGVVILNSLDIYIFGLEIARSFMLESLADPDFFKTFPRYWPDKIIIKQIVSLPYIFLLLFSYGPLIADSPTIKNKSYYRSWLSLYMISALVMMVTLSINYYDIFGLHSDVALERILMVNGILVSLYFSINPAFLHSFPLISKPVKVIFNPDLSDKYWVLERLMHEDSLYLTKGLSSADICLRIGINQPDLSRLLKLKTGGNLNQYINSYRIRYAISKLNEPSYMKRYSLHTLGNQSGFSSNSSFYRAFKNERSMTPAHYYETVVNSDRGSDSE